MTRGAGDPTSMRHRLLRAIGPEAVALALIVVIAFGVLLAVWSGSRQAGPGPSGQPESSAAAVAPAV